MKTTIVITRVDDGSFTVHAHSDALNISIKSCLWRTLEAAEAEARRIVEGWKYGTGAVLVSGGVA
jgi:hypothetical protein